jgi:hypothetical protein
MLCLRLGHGEQQMAHITAQKPSGDGDPAEERTPNTRQIIPTERDIASLENEYWHALIDEDVGGEFLGLSTRTMQGMRQRGGGPNFIALSARCVRYRRIDLVTWCDQHLRRSTADTGANAEPKAGTSGTYHDR